MGMGYSRKLHLPVHRVANYDHTSGLKCSYCSGILWKPVQCNTCAAIFCAACIKLKSDPQPTCRNNCLPLVEQACPKRIVDKLSQLKTTCIYKDSGCSKVLPYNLFDSFADHQEHCEFQKQKCTLCSEYIVLKFLEEHKFKCALEVTICEQCGMSLKRKDLPTHIATNCLQEAKEVSTVVYTPQIKKVESVSSFNIQKEVPKAKAQPQMAQKALKYLSNNGELLRVSDILKEPTDMLLP